jgi:hypothetical protein
MSEWQPIETAPKDGTPILIWQPDRDPKPNDGYCDDHRYAIGYWRLAHPGWTINATPWGNRNSASVNPTHWMPLPEPPR